MSISANMNEELNVEKTIAEEIRLMNENNARNPSNSFHVNGKVSFYHSYSDWIILLIKSSDDIPRRTQPKQEGNQKNEESHSNIINKSSWQDNVIEWVMS